MEIYSEALATIYQYREMASVKYFLKEILPDMLAEKGIEKTELPQLTTEITTKALRDA